MFQAELVSWFETQCTVLGLDATQAAWARTSVLQAWPPLALHQSLRCHLLHLNTPVEGSWIT